ncbi:MAG: outer membrane lipoprotein-sorting protein [Verrucomicrobia bacterium]|nr:outer membrane lipoprotein-sorting protein [Verrucomicrobiota bacterium]MCF7707358.1 outer membrane lipoprotein-sorting protein [Verrucomicrobiota bacterium]
MRTPIKHAQALVLTLIACLCGLGCVQPINASEDGNNNEAKLLVRDLLSRKPAENQSLRGTLEIRRGYSSSTRIPLEFHVKTSSTNWSVTYDTSESDRFPARLIIVHSSLSTNKYLYSGRELKKHELISPFASSDFWIFDLGLEFLHWPEQRIIKTQMRKGRTCRVLESVNPNPAPEAYSRVLSWIDIETHGLILAEAYDADNKLLKKFSVKSLEKTGNKWQLEEIEMRNLQTDSRSTIEFDIE